MRVFITIIISTTLFFAVNNSLCQTDSASLSVVNQLDLSTESNLVQDTITIIGVGDIMLGTDYPSPEYLHPSDDCNLLLKEVKSYLKDADVTFGNLEGVFAGDKGTAKQCNNPDHCYVFRMPVNYVECIVNAGFDLISVANNHVNDFGYHGIQNTAKILKEAELAFSGFSEYPYTILELDSIKYGFCSFAPHSGTVDLRKIEKAVEIVAMLDTLADIVVVSFHGGAEGKSHQHVTKETEYFYDYDRGNVYEFSHAVVDAGADVIFGHGPHVTRAIEVYKERLICYSLGNFCTYRRFNLSGPNGYAPMMKVYTNKSGEFLKGQIIPVFQSGDGITRIDFQNRAIKKIKELTELDFPDNNLIINNNGTVLIKEKTQ